MSFGELNLLNGAALGLPLVFLAGVSLYHTYQQRSHAPADGHSQEKQELEKLRAAHAALKDAVLKAEVEENRSLQIYGVAKSLAEALSWKDMAPRLAAGIQKIFGGFEFLLYSLDSQNQWTLLHRRGSWTKEPPLNAPLAALADAVHLVHPPQVVEVVPVLIVPIYSTETSGRHKNGVLFLKSSSADRNEQELVEAGREFGEQLGMALNKARLFSEVEMHSRLDGLTGALRRQPFMERLNEELKRASVFHTPFSLLMVDIDHFKAVNDSHGHAAGDAVLARVGQILKESFYETDVVGRYGGEEFIVLLPRAEQEGVLRKAESLRQRFERETIPSGFERLRITVSIGLSHHPENGKSAEALIAQADKALYEAKRTGRNKVVAA